MRPRSGWSPEGMPGLLNTLARLDEATGSSRGVPNWAMTHPPAADRVERVHDAVAAAEGSNANARATNAGEFERHLDGLVFGDSREKGMVRGNEFIHPVLRFALRFPQGWEIVNTDAQVSARESGTSNVAMLLELVPGNGSPEQLARSAFSQSGLQLVDGERTRINGLDAFVGTYEGVIQNTSVGLRAAFVRSGQQTYVIAGLAPAAQFNGAARAFETSIGTFRAISAEEADRIRENHVDFYTARAGDTWESIARGAGRRPGQGIDAGDHERQFADGAASRRRSAPHRHRRVRSEGWLRFDSRAGFAGWARARSSVWSRSMPACRTPGSRFRTCAGCAATIRTRPRSCVFAKPKPVATARRRRRHSGG